MKSQIQIKEKKPNYIIEYKGITLIYFENYIILS